jgi:hypothetical protein
LTRRLGDRDFATADSWTSRLSRSAMVTSLVLLSAARHKDSMGCECVMLCAVWCRCRRRCGNGSQQQDLISALQCLVWDAPVLDPPTTKPRLETLKLTPRRPPLSSRLLPCLSAFLTAEPQTLYHTKFWAVLYLTGRSVAVVLFRPACGRRFPLPPLRPGTSTRLAAVSSAVPKSTAFMLLPRNGPEVTSLPSNVRMTISARFTNCPSPFEPQYIQTSR